MTENRSRYPLPRRFRWSTPAARPKVEYNQDHMFQAGLVLSVGLFVIAAAAFIYAGPRNFPNAFLLEMIADSCPLFGGIMCLMGAFIARFGRPRLGYWMVILGLWIAGTVTNFVAQGYGLVIALSVFVTTAMISSYVITNQTTARATALGFTVGITDLLLDLFGGKQRTPGAEQFRVFFPIACAFIIIVYGLMLARQYRYYSLRARLVIMFLLVALAPVTALAYYNNNSFYSELSKAANQSLSAAASQTSLQIDDFIRTNKYALDHKAHFSELTAYLSLHPDERIGSVAEKKAEALLSSSFQQDYSASQYILGYTLFDVNGKILYDTSKIDKEKAVPFLGLKTADEALFNSMLSGNSYVSSIIFLPDWSQPYFAFLARIVGPDLKPLGVLAARYDADILQYYLDRSNSLAGQGSFAVLVDDQGTRIARGLMPSERYTTISEMDAAKVTNLQLMYRLPNVPLDQIIAPSDGMEHILQIADSNTHIVTGEAAVGNNELYQGAAQSLIDKSWFLVYVEPQTLFQSPVEAQTRSVALGALVIAVIAGLLGVGSAQMATGPVSRLTKVAEKVTEGDLYAQAIEGPDEIGKLGQSFNIMTGELRTTLETLEQRVAERTSELAKASDQMKYRATQLTTVAEVAHAIASVQESDQLLKMVCELISDRFRFYHVGIFLIDKAGEFAVLQAANSEGGQRMLARGHRLKVGQVGIVGYATGHGQPRVALDVGKDAIFFDNPDLPYTRSEMALPLKVGDRVIGALDVQSMEQSAFSTDDISLLSTLADQVAIAIQNSQLFTETRTALNELQHLHRQYIQQEWSQLANERPKTAYAYQHGKIVSTQADHTADIWGALKGSDPILMINAPESNGNGSPADSPSLVAPITVRGEVIGVLNLADPLSSGQEEQAWSEEDINLVKTIADQVGQALENARLIEETQHRAEREHLVSEITGKMRASNDPKAILETAVFELKRALRVKQAQIVLQPAAGSVQPADEEAPHANDGNDVKEKPASPPDDASQSGGSE